MRSLLGSALATILIAVSLVGAAGASAATEIGDTCAVNGGAPNYTFVQLSRAAAGPPLTAPAAGVITEWKMNVTAMLPGSIPQELKVMRATGKPNEFTVVGASEVANVSTGQNAFKTRIPIQAGDTIGVSSPVGGLATLYCQSENLSDSMGVFEGDVPVGGTQTFTPVPKVEQPAAAIVEPDADNDGFGDETQDKCPQSAALQTECPVVLVDSFPLLKKGSVVVLVATSSTAPVTVSGTVKLPKGAGASSSGQAKLKKVTHTVTPGKLGRFTLKFPGPLKAALAGLPAGKSLKLKLKASAKDLAGQTTSDKSTLKLKGTGR